MSINGDVYKTKSLPPHPAQNVLSVSLVHMMCVDTNHHGEIMWRHFIHHAHCTAITQYYAVYTDKAVTAEVKQLT
jgi:hypothetical protein